ncbi:MAG: hypothetical protein IJZ73_06580 [Clostridia bacterium]|nr:hypothetical protein [Clostridia bacterium]
MLDKKKYKQAEVNLLLEERTAEYESKLNSKNTLINELKAENDRLKNEILLLKNKDELTVSALKRAENTAKKTEEKATIQYALTLERLKAFTLRWTAYFETLKEKYPLYPAVQDAIKLKEKLEDALEKKDVKKAFATAEKIFFDKTQKDNAFNPKEKIQDYIAATSDNGFNLDEVLNPGKLELEDLCKELGLLTEEE